MIMALARGVAYLGSLAMIVGVALGAHVYGWEVIVCAVVLAVSFWANTKAYRMGTEVIAMQDATINAQHEMIKDLVAELKRQSQ